MLTKRHNYPEKFPVSSVRTIPTHIEKGSIPRPSVAMTVTNRLFQWRRSLWSVKVF